MTLPSYSFKTKILSYTNSGLENAVKTLRGKRVEYSMFDSVSNASKCLFGHGIKLDREGIEDRRGVMNGKSKVWWP